MIWANFKINLYSLEKFVDFNFFLNLRCISYYSNAYSYELSKCHGFNFSNEHKIK